MPVKMSKIGEKLWNIKKNLSYIRNNNGLVLFGFTIRDAQIDAI